MRSQLTECHRRRPTGAVDLLGPFSRRGVGSRRRSDRGGDGQRFRLPRCVVSSGRCSSAISIGPDPSATSCSRPSRQLASRGNCPTACWQLTPQDATFVTLLTRSRGRMGARVLPGGGDPTQKPEGRLEIDLLVGDEQWLERLLLRLAPAAEVVSPSMFADRFKESGFGDVQPLFGLYSGDRVTSNQQQLS